MSTTPTLEQDTINAKRDEWVLRICAEYLFPNHVGDLAKLLKIAYHAGATAGLEAAQNLLGNESKRP